MPAADEIRAKIAAAGGAIPFSEFQRLALYGRGGFYESGRAGRRGGDFVTSPEVGPLFGTLIARYLDARWAELDRPDPFDVVEVGAGPGTLARAVLAAQPACSAAMRYRAVEVSASQRAAHPDGIESTDVAPAGPIDAVVVANELLDNLPVRLCVFDGGWREAFVVTDGDRFAEVLSAPFDPVPAVLPASPAHGARAPLLSEAASWVAATVGSLRTGSLLVVDYARATTAEFARLPWREWLRTYRSHERGDHYLAAPGIQDITVDVAVDQLPPADRVETQSAFLGRYGIAELVEEGRTAWQAAASAPTVAALRMRSRVSEAEALLDPSGLGSFTVLEWRRRAGHRSIEGPV